MNELPLILLGGVLGSSHCVGMCGGFALSIGATAPNVMQNLTRQLIYSAGRVFTYGFLGAAGRLRGLVVLSPIHASDPRAVHSFSDGRRVPDRSRRSRSA